MNPDSRLILISLLLSCGEASTRPETPSQTPVRTEAPAKSADTAARPTESPVQANAREVPTKTEPPVETEAPGGAEGSSTAEVPTGTDPPTNTGAPGSAGKSPGTTPIGSTTPPAQAPRRHRTPGPLSGSGSGSGAGSILNDDDLAASMLAAHNAARAEVGVPPLSWSAELAGISREWASQLSAEGCEMRHRKDPNRAYGQNLFIASVGFGGGKARIEPTEVVADWVGEKADFNAATNECAPGKTCGHYTQIVWRDTRELGCAMAGCPDNSQIWVCSYQPRGNRRGRRPY